MTDLHDFEDEIRGMLADVEARAQAPDGLAARLITRAPEGLAEPLFPAAPPHRVGTLRTVGRRAPRWLPPLLAAAAVIAVVAGASAIVSSVSADRDQAATHTPAPSSTVTQQDSQQKSPPTPTNHAVPPSVTAVPAGFVAANVWFADAQRGYATGNVPCQARPGYCATLIRTEDSGGHWAAMSVPQGITPVDDKGNVSGGSCGTNGNVYGPCVDKVAFPDPLNGYLWSWNSFYSTTDGGRTWHQEPDSGTQHGYARASQMAFTATQALRIGPVADCSSGCAFQVQSARIGSSTWHTVTPSAPKPFTHGQLLAAGGTVYVAAQADQQNGSSVGPILIYRWTGSGWQKVPTDACTQPGALSTAPDGTAFLLCQPVPAVPTVQRVGSSTGATHPVTPVPPGSDVQLVAVSAERLQAFVASSTATDTEYASTDGGVSWHNAGSVQPWTPVTDTFGFRLGPDGTSVDVTTDGGATFHPTRFR